MIFKYGFKVTVCQMNQRHPPPTLRPPLIIFLQWLIGKLGSYGVLCVGKTHFNMTDLYGF